MHSKTDSVPLVATWDKVAEGYTLEIASAEREIVTEFITVLDSIGVDKTKSLLELGCGSGHLSGLLAQQGYNVSLLDFSSKALNKAREFFDHYDVEGSFLEGDLLDLANLPGDYDVVWNSGVMEHFDDEGLRRALQSIQSVTKGFFIFLVPNPLSLPYLIFRYKTMREGKWIYGEEYLRKDYEDFLHEAGFKVLQKFLVGKNFTKEFMKLVLESEVNRTTYNELVDFDLMPRDDYYLIAYVTCPGNRQDAPIRAEMQDLRKTELFTQKFDCIAYREGLKNQVFINAAQENELQSLRQQLQESHNQATLVEAERHNLKQDFSNLKQNLNNLLAEKNKLHDRLNVTITELDLHRQELHRIYTSNCWKVASFYYRMVQKVGVLQYLRNLMGQITHRDHQGLVPRDNDPALSVQKQLHPLDAERECRIADLPPGTLSGNKYDVIFFPMIDFSFRYQRPQQLASYFARFGHRVFYMNISEFLPQDATMAYKVNELKENVLELFVRSPDALDVYGGTLTEQVADCLWHSFRTLNKEWNLATAVAVVHNPFWYPLAARAREQYGWKIVYDCLDEWVDFKHIGPFFLQQEAELVNHCDLLTVTAELLHQKWSNQNPNGIVVRNACDYDHFRLATKGSLLADVQPPIVGFFGGIAEWIDVEAIHKAATGRPDWSFVLIGGVFTDVSLLQRLPNVHLLGNKPYHMMPDYLARFDVCLIPFRKNRLTEAVDPVKLYEYFSQGKPVVARQLYELSTYQDVIYFYDDSEGLAEAIETALAENGTEKINKRTQIAKTNTWNVRIKSITDGLLKTYSKVSIIIVSYNNLEYNKLCMDSIMSKTEYLNYEVIIVDNHSVDGSREYFKQLGDNFPFIKVILNDENHGFARANNQGITLASGDYLVLLNNDTVVTKGWLSRLVWYLEKFPQIGLIGPVTNQCGNEARIDVSYVDLADMDHFAWCYTRDHESEFFDIRMLALFCSAMRRKTLDEVGMLDERFGIGMFEDDDFSLRIKRAGYRVVCAEDIFIHHHGQGAFKELIETGEYDQLFERNRKLYEEKWGVVWEPHELRKS